jgi:putative PIN family toxin of toxin-antitoxin system
MTTLVLDTNIVLDVFVFADEVAKPLLPALTEGRLHWVATSAMRDELARVLDYPQIVPRLAFYGLVAGDVLAGFDRHAQVVEAPSKAPVTCSDPDDQKFIDLAVAHKALLISKDKQVLRLTNRLARLSVCVKTAF